MVFVFSCKKEETSDEIKEEGKVTSLKKVLIIGIDGCRPDALVKANTPNLDALMANGTFSLDARNTDVTSSGPGWSAMLTGVWSNKHGVVDNSFSGNKFSRYPHFFKMIKEAIPGSKTVSISQWHPINKNIAVTGADALINTNDTSVATKESAVNALSNGDETAFFVHFDDVDHAGHGSGFSVGNPNYLNAIETVDTQIGDIVATIKARENYREEDWLILVSTDHGGLGTSHGGTSEEERTIFLIASGDQIPQREIKKTTKEISVAPVENCLDSDKELAFKDTAVKIENSEAYNFGSTKDFSIECRFRSSSASDVSILAKKDWNSGLLPGYVFSFKPSNKKFKVNIGDGANRVDVETNEISDNKWHTISATFDRDGMLKVYIDGAFIKATSIATIGDINTDLPFTIGADGNLSYMFTGFIAEVRVFNGLLDPLDILDWQCKELEASHNKYADLIGYWKLDKAEGNSILDESISKNNATLLNGVFNDAKENSIIEVHNYNDTPRTVDVVTTALNHLCIPIQDNWSLDGKSLINTACNK